MRKNMLIISSSVDLLINLLIEEEQLDTKNNEELLRNLFGENFFDVGNTLKKLPTKELRDNKIYKIMGTDRTVISRLCSGKASNIPHNMMCFFKNNFGAEGTELCNGQIHIEIVTEMEEKVNDVIEKYIKNYKTATTKSEKEDKNRDIIKNIKNYIKEYLKDDAFYKSEDENSGYLKENWLFKFMKKIFKELQKDGEKAEVIIKKLSELKKGDFDGWDSEQIEDAAKKVYDLYIKLVALHTYKEWK